MAKSRRQRPAIARTNAPILRRALTLDVGDTVMMVSDGALCDGSAWLCDQLTLSTRLGQSPQQTAEAVAASAVRRSGARQDDITVAIVRLERQKS